MADISPAEAEGVARARWRADLLNLAAADHRRIAGDDPSPTAQALLADATRKEAEATIHLDHADAAQKLAEAKAALEANPGNEAAIAAQHQAAQEITDLRRYWRQIGEATGGVPHVMTVDDFPEPTADEVLASHGGAN